MRKIQHKNQAENSMRKGVINPKIYYKDMFGIHEISLSISKWIVAFNLKIGVEKIALTVWLFLVDSINLFHPLTSLSHSWCVNFFRAYSSWWYRRDGLNLIASDAINSWYQYGTKSLIEINCQRDKFSEKNVNIIFESF